MTSSPLKTIFSCLQDAEIQYLVVGGVAVVLHGHMRFTADLDLVIKLEDDNVRTAMEALDRLGYRPRIPVPAIAFADASVRKRWIEDKGLMVFSLWNPDHPGSEIDVFVEEPFSFEDAWQNRVDADLDDGVVVPVVGLRDLQELKRKAGRPKDLVDLEKLEIIQRAILQRKNHE